MFSCHCTTTLVTSSKIALIINIEFMAAAKLEKLATCQAAYRSDSIGYIRPHRCLSSMETSSYDVIACYNRWTYFLTCGQIRLNHVTSCINVTVKQLKYLLQMEYWQMQIAVWAKQPIHHVQPPTLSANTHNTPQSHKANVVVISSLQGRHI